MNQSQFFVRTSMVTWSEDPMVSAPRDKWCEMRELQDTRREIQKLFDKPTFTKSEPLVFAAGVMLGVMAMLMIWNICSEAKKK